MPTSLSKKYPGKSVIRTQSWTKDGGKMHFEGSLSDVALELINAILVTEFVKKSW